MDLEKFTDGNEFLESFLKNKEYIYITSLTHEYVDITRNWYESLKRINSHHLALVISLDEKCYRLMHEYNIPTVYWDAGITTNKTYEDWIENEKKTKIRGPYYIIKNFDIDIIHSEVDIIFFKDPIQKLKQEISNGYDITVISDRRFDTFYPNREQGIVSHVDIQGKINTFGDSYQKKYGIQNFGFSYMPVTQKILDFWGDLRDISSDFMKKFETNDERGWLQTILIERLKHFDIKAKTMSTFEFANGSIWSNPILKEKIKDNLYLVHYNFSDDELKSKKNGKISLMKENGHWYID